MSMYCVSVFDGEQFAGEWFDSLKDAKGYMDACFEDGTWKDIQLQQWTEDCLLYTSPSPRDYAASRMPSSA